LFAKIIKIGIPNPNPSIVGKIDVPSFTTSIDNAASVFKGESQFCEILICIDDDVHCRYRCTTRRLSKLSFNKRHTHQQQSKHQHLPKQHPQQQQQQQQHDANGDNIVAFSALAVSIAVCRLSRRFSVATDVFRRRRIGGVVALRVAAGEGAVG
jgi:hypothetical protein